MAPASAAGSRHNTPASRGQSSKSPHTKPNRTTKSPYTRSPSSSAPSTGQKSVLVTETKQLVQIISRTPADKYNKEDTFLIRQSVNGKPLRRLYSEVEKLAPNALKDFMKKVSDGKATENSTKATGEIVINSDSESSDQSEQPTVKRRVMKSPSSTEYEKESTIEFERDSASETGPEDTGEEDEDLEEDEDPHFKVIGGLKRSTKPTRASERKQLKAADLSTDDSPQPEVVHRRKPRSKSLSATSQDEGTYVTPAEDEEVLNTQYQHVLKCAKCEEGPAFLTIKNIKKRKGRKKRRDEFEWDTESEIDNANNKGAWVKCGTCIEVFHYGCLPKPSQVLLVDKLKADHLVKYQKSNGEDDEEMQVDAPPRPKFERNVKSNYVVDRCGYCIKPRGRNCFVCHVSGRKNILSKGEILAGETEPPSIEEVNPALMFRCATCHRAGHYNCLPREDEKEDMTIDEQAKSYLDDGRCHQCWSYSAKLDAILAWAPIPNAEVEKDSGVKVKDPKTGEMVAIPNPKDGTWEVQYLVKWEDQSYRQLEWVPHAYLVSRYYQKLTNFLSRGSQVKYLRSSEDVLESDAEEESEDAGSPPLPDPEATEKIPPSWSTVDRVLDVWYKNETGSLVNYSNYKYKIPDDPEESAKLVAECYFKWGDLDYEQCTREAPPDEDEPEYKSFTKAYKAFLVASKPSMRVPVLTASQINQLRKPQPKSKFKPITTQPEYILSGTLKPFQLDGVSFLYFKWWERRGCILADEMGLGKTVQIITFLSVLAKEQGARPFLVTVPNSTLGNWVREFEKWAPEMRVVPYGGSSKSRRIIENYELFAENGKTLKTHVVLATYEAVQNNISVFKRVSFWECLVVDEGQRLKGGAKGLFFSCLRMLNIGQRVLLTGTPLNNNLSELFALLSFIDPDNPMYSDANEIKERYSELDAEKVEEIRGTLKPYFLRRTKERVLDLPPISETVVPVSMTVLQRELYRGVLEKNAAAINSMINRTGGKVKSSFNNLLMSLRKILCHPYLLADDIEPVGLSREQTLKSLIEASSKLIVLEKLLPKLKAKGHRVLIFSQFKITLNILEDFFRALGLSYLRLDGDTPQLDRQRGIDAFQKEGSDIFAYMLTTRAGGVGINLTKADVVIIYDQDFNPHQDAQAIARAHRIGQVKPVRVYRLMVKNTCEEKIYHTGNKKLGLDHLIIQRINTSNEDDSDVVSVLQYGAKEIFDDKASEDARINYDDATIEKLIQDTEPVTSKKSDDDSAAAFSHANVWDASKGKVGTATPEVEEDQNLHSFWADIIAKNEEAAKKQQELAFNAAGRGKRKRNPPMKYLDGLLSKQPAPNASQPGISDSSGDEEFRPAGREESSVSSEGAGGEVIVISDLENDEPHQKKSRLGEGPSLPRYVNFKGVRDTNGVPLIHNIGAPGMYISPLDSMGKSHLAGPLPPVSHLLLQAPAHYAQNPALLQAQKRELLSLPPTGVSAIEALERYRREEQQREEERKAKRRQQRAKRNEQIKNRTNSINEVIIRAQNIFEGENEIDKILAKALDAKGREQTEFLKEATAALRVLLEKKRMSVVNTSSLGPIRIE